MPHPRVPGGDWKTRNPEKAAAGRALRNAVKRGVMRRPATCSVCQREKPHGHHDDYSKPLEVVWYCGRHHRVFHGFAAMFGVDWGHKLTAKFDLQGRPYVRAFNAAVRSTRAHRTRAAAP